MNPPANRDRSATAPAPVPTTIKRAEEEARMTGEGAPPAPADKARAAKPSPTPPGAKPAGSNPATECKTGAKDADAAAGIPSKSELRALAQKELEEGPVTAAYGADRDKVVELLNGALATEIVCVLRYKRHYYTAQGTRGETVAAEFLEHANEEQGHADRIAQRIVQLGGEPDFDPAGLLERGHSDYVEGRTLEEMVREDLVAERVAIEAYAAMIRYVGDGDPTTRRMLEEILANEEEHADDLRDLLVDMGRGDAGRRGPA